MQTLKNNINSVVLESQNNIWYYTLLKYRKLIIKPNNVRKSWFPKFRNYS